MNLAPEHHPTETQPYLPHYEVIAPLGEGAVATVYKVRSVRDGALLALKSLKAVQAAKPLSIRRFQDEFRILNRLQHPGLPHVFDYRVGRDGTHYIVMELVEGEPIDHYVAENNSELWFLVYQLTEALAFVHDHRLLHLDLKPDNALIKRTRAFGDRSVPLVTLIDFGLSYQRDVGGETETVGTAHYMSPEIIRRDDKLTRAADYYSLGALLYELIEGKPPFEGSVHDILQAHLTKPVKFSHKKVEFAELYPWVEQLMSKDPNERLTAFQEFRRMVATRQSEPIRGLERAYALGYIESLGMFGKRGVWDELEKWAGALQEMAGSEVDEPVRAVPIDAPEKTKDFLLDSSAPDLTEAIKRDLLSQAAEEPDDPLPAPGVRHPRYISLVGPPGSGKSYIIDAIRSEVRPRGIEFVSVNDQSQFEDLLSSTRRQKSRVDPSSVRLDRFVTAWERLREMARKSGLVIAADDCGQLPEEAREFVEYVIKRLELLSSGGDEVGISVVVTDESPELKKKLGTLLADDASMQSFDIPPPGTKDIDAIVSEFHGHMAGADHRKALGAFLRRHLETDGAVMLALREAVADGDLNYEFGQWQFRESDTSKQRSSTTAEYYKKVFHGLGEGSQELIRWLCCHKGRITLRQLEDLSGLDHATVWGALENLKPYHIIELVSVNDNDHLELVSNDVREAFYGLLDDPLRQTTHEAYIEYFEGYDDRRVSGLESLTYQYEQAGMVREALIARIRALRKAKRGRQRNDVVRLCNDGIRFARGVTAGVTGVIAAEKFFIKGLIDIAWLVNDYRGLVSLVEAHYTLLGRYVPINLFYKYGYSLVSAGEFGSCEEFLAVGNERVAALDLRGVHQSLSLVEACLFYETGKPSDALPALERIQPRTLPLPTRARYYIYRMLVHQALGDFDERKRYMNLARKAARTVHNTEFLLRINYNIGMFLLNQGMYSEAKLLMRTSIRIASRSNSYRSLCTMYFIASGAYHEEGNYLQAIRYLDRAIQLATDIGMKEHVNGYVARSALNYRNLGQYGVAIRNLQVVRSRLEPGDTQHFFASTLLLDIYTAINSRYAEALAIDTGDVAARHSNQTAALFYFFLGNHFRNKGEHKRAILEYNKSLDIYERIRVEDDVIRVRLGMAYAHLGQNRIDDAVNAISEVEAATKDIQSKEIKFEASIARLSCVLVRPLRAEKLQEAIDLAERQYDLTHEFRNQTQMDGLLFEAYLELGRRPETKRAFDRYYSSVKDTCGRLPHKGFVDDYLASSEFVARVDKFRNFAKKNRARE